MHKFIYFSYISVGVFGNKRNTGFDYPVKSQGFPYINIIQSMKY